MLAATVAVMMLTGCQQDMATQPSQHAQDASELFRDGRAARPLVANTVFRGNLRDSDALWTGKENGKDVEKFPIDVTKDVLLRGQDRFNIYCAPCHSKLGDGDGMVVRRGVKRPPSFTDDRLLTAPVGYYFGVVTNGFGSMYPYDHIPVRDRWAIIAYVKALQFSQRATLNDVPEADRQKLMAAPVAANAAATVHTSKPETTTTVSHDGKTTPTGEGHQ